MKTYYKIYHPNYEIEFTYDSFHNALAKLNQLTLETGLCFELKVIKER